MNEPIVTSPGIPVFANGKIWGGWWPKPGSICRDGSIITATRQPFYYGTIWIERRRLAAAVLFGWQEIPEYDEFNQRRYGPLVTVHR